MEELCSIDAYKMTPERVAQLFAESYFDKPRKLDKITPNSTFTLVDGVRTYQVVFIKGDCRTTVDRYAVIVAEEEPKTDLGKKLTRIRKKAVRKGMTLLTEEEILNGIRE